MTEYLQEKWANGQYTSNMDEYFKIILGGKYYVLYDFYIKFWKIQTNSNRKEVRD